MSPPDLGWPLRRRGALAALAVASLLGIPLVFWLGREPLARDAACVAQGMSLREIFLTLARTKRGPGAEVRS